MVLSFSCQLLFSFLSYAAAFGLLGYLAFELNTEVYELVESGQQLFLVALISALSRVPAASLVFVLVLLAVVFAVVLRDQFILTDGVISSAADLCCLPSSRLMGRSRRRVFALSSCAAMLIFSLATQVVINGLI